MRIKMKMRRIRKDISKIKFLTLVSSIVSLSAMPATGAGLRLMDDTYVSLGKPNKNFGKQSFIQITESKNIGYLRFSLSGAPQSGSLAKATLRVFVSQKTGATGKLKAYESSTDIGELQLNNPNALSAENPVNNDEPVIPERNQWVEFDVTDYVRERLSDRTNSTVSFALKGSEGLKIKLDSKENKSSSHEAELDVIWDSTDGAAIPVGEKGPTGDQGPVGPQGPVGNQGPSGPQGPAGNKGLIGDQGPVGDKGPTGDKGPAGDKGPIGDQGPAGNKGPTGDQGPVGDKGPIGDQGPAGVQGPVGDKGPMGDQGPIGDQGPVGPQGPVGEQGPVGPQGPAGDKGATGDQGPQGPAGDKGATGDQGPIGLQGPVGDKGPTGDQGPAGDKGPTGDQGPQGPMGEIGTILSGTTSGSIGGSGLGSNTCTTGTASIPGAEQGMVVLVTPSGGTIPGSEFFWDGYVSAADTVTVRVCNAKNGNATPTATTYTVRVIP
jgi:hypothetical protein